MPLVLWVPARRLASCQLTIRARMSRRTWTPNTPSSSSISPTSSLSRFLTWSFISLVSRLRRLASGAFGRGLARRRLPDRRREGQLLGRRALHRVGHQDIAAGAARHRAAQHDEAALGV